MIYMIMAGYFEDDSSDELTNNPVFKTVLEKSALASQPTVSRFFNRMDEDTLKQFQEISRILKKKDLHHPDASGRDLGSDRKAGHLTSIIRVMATIRSSVMTEALVI